MIDHGLEFVILMTRLVNISRPESRVAEHLLRLDMHETIRFAQRHPDRLQRCEASDAV